MTRILYWNIQQFSVNKLHDPSKLDYIRQVLTTHLPHIISIVEVQSGAAIPYRLDGTLLSGGAGTQGALQLLNHVKNWTNNDDWCLVPPLTLGDGRFREGVAVYFDSAHLQFTGPYWWTDNFGGNNPINRAVPSNTAGARRVAYDQPWNTLPNTPVANNNALPVANRGIRQNQLAGQFQYFSRRRDRQKNFIEIFFPTGREGNIADTPPLNRAPFLTTFYEPNTQRNIKLFSVHTSPKTAKKAVENLAQVQEIRKVVPRQVSVIAGDFNVDSFTRFNTYNYLLNNGYRMHLDPRDDNQNIDVARQPYCMTHLLSAPNNLGDPQGATPYMQSDPQGLSPHTETGTQQAQLSPGGNYPSFGYMGSKAGQNFQQITFAASIDNIFTQYGRQINPPQTHNTTIINPVVGSPYLFGQGYQFPHMLINPVPQAGLLRPANPANPANPDPNLIQFHQPQNYGHIRRTSDHLAIIIDV
ncbi:MAG: hypothetical protein QNJ54_21935 [Prochloraceae cyanobacterium]|nr:hypothetical protein [Prochloraceae cyanobacterium]